MIVTQQIEQWLQTAASIGGPVSVIAGALIALYKKGYTRGRKEQIDLNAINEIKISINEIKNIYQKHSEDDIVNFRDIHKALEITNTTLANFTGKLDEHLRAHHND